jgi:hypothetical protein
MFRDRQIIGDYLQCLCFFGDLLLPVVVPMNLLFLLNLDVVLKKFVRLLLLLLLLLLLPLGLVARRNTSRNTWLSPFLPFLVVVVVCAKRTRLRQHWV